MVLDDLPERLEGGDVADAARALDDPHDPVLAAAEPLILAPIVGAALPAHALDAIPEVDGEAVCVEPPLVGRGLPVHRRLGGHAPRERGLRVFHESREGAGAPGEAERLGEGPEELLGREWPPIAQGGARLIPRERGEKIQHRAARAGG